MAQVQYQAVGRRKKAIARVRLVPGDGKVVINGRDIDNYFGLETLKMTVRQPLALTNLEGPLTGLFSQYTNRFNESNVPLAPRYCVSSAFKNRPIVGS